MIIWYVQASEGTTKFKLKKFCFDGATTNIGTSTGNHQIFCAKSLFPCNRPQEETLNQAHNQPPKLLYNAQTSMSSTPALAKSKRHAIIQSCIYS